jgi:ABC-type transport system involved in multi-copper enzyme maturation permease subunit
MALRLGPGPVFVYEWLTTSRRWQLYAVRAGFVGLVLIGLAIVQSDRPWHARSAMVSLRDLAVIGEQMYWTITLLELTLVLLAAPAATAGAVCLDKARGTLDHMLVTDLSNAEIVLGKLAVRLVPVLGLIACTVPVLALSTLLGGVDPLALLGLFLVAVGCALVGCTPAMVLSMYGQKTHEVLMMTYMIIITWLVAPLLLQFVHWLVSGLPAWVAAASVWAALHDWAEWSNPYLLALAPYNSPGRASVGTYLGFLAGSLAVSTALTVLATLRIRRVTLQQAGRPSSVVRSRRSRLLRLFSLSWLPGPSLDGNPVAWREWHRMRPSLMMRVAWGLYAALGLLGIGAAVSSWSWIGPPSAGLMLVNMFQVAVGLLLLSVSAATSLAEERARGSLDVLLTTPMSTRSILVGKWWGSFRRVLNVVFWPAAMLIVPAISQGHWASFLALLGLVVASGAAITSLGLAIATWVSRLGRAVALCVTVYVVFVIAWPILVFFLLASGSDYLAFVLWTGDPPFGAALMTIATVEEHARIAGGSTFDDLIIGPIFFIMAYIGATRFLNWVTYSTFDRRLGRIGDDGRPPSARRTGRSSLSTAELLAKVPSASRVHGEDLDETGE